MDKSVKRLTQAFVLNGCSPDDVAKAMIESGRQKEPFYIFDMDEVYNRIQCFKRLMPRIQIFYAIKANPSDMILKLAVSLGLGFDCASPGEISKIRQLNVNPQSIIYAMPIKTPEQMIFARASGVRHTTFDTSYELKKIRQYWPDARLLLRIRVDGDSVYNLGDKFGCDFETEAKDLLDKAANLGLQVVGIAFHVGSACASPKSYEVGLKHAKVLFEYEKNAGREMKIVDIGGGFFNDTYDRIDRAAKVINKSLEQMFPENVQVIAEPGRYLCDSSTTLYCNISNVQQKSKEGRPVNVIYLNDGVYGGLRYPETWQTVKKFRRSKETFSNTLEETILWGPTCDCRDRVMANYTIRLPRCTPLDWLVFGIQGAYTFTYSANFCYLEAPAMRPVISSELWNKIKCSKVFDPIDMLQNPDISAPLPLKLPHISPNNIIQYCELTKLST